MHGLRWHGTTRAFWQPFRAIAIACEWYYHCMPSHCSWYFHKVQFSLCPVIFWWESRYCESVRCGDGLLRFWPTEAASWRMMKMRSLMVAKFAHFYLCIVGMSLLTCILYKCIYLGVGICWSCVECKHCAKCVIIHNFLCLFGFFDQSSLVWNSGCH